MVRKLELRFLSAISGIAVLRQFGLGKNRSTQVLGSIQMVPDKIARAGFLQVRRSALASKPLHTRHSPKKSTAQAAAR
jgi:hypothetical protein